MALRHSPKIVTDGLVLYLDAANPLSYPGSGTTWFDLSNFKKNWTFGASVWSHSASEGTFNVNNTGNYVGRSGTDYATITNGTFVIWFKTTDDQSLFLSENLSAYENFLGAYRVGNKYYNSLNSGTPTLHKNTSTISNLYDNIRTGTFMMLEFKGVDFTGFGSMYFNGYYGPSFRFNNTTDVSILQIYNKQLSAAESIQNYNALKSRYGL